MLYAQALQEGATFTYCPRVPQGPVILKSQIGHRCTVVDAAGKEFEVSCEDLAPTAPEPLPAPFITNADLDKIAVKLLERLDKETP